MKIKNILPVAIVLLSNLIFAQVPLLNSNPTFTKVVYLDFDGETVTGTAWNTSYSITTINAVASSQSTANIVQIWKRITEDYRPFDVNITTDVAKFNAAPATKRIRVIVTSTSSWFGSAGGVAYLGSFTWGGNPTTPCWVFENQLGNSAKNIAEAASHEVGHTLTLKHQSTWTASTCSKTAEYNPGQGSGMTSWAPIMGVGYSKNVTVWHKGTNSTSCTTIQFDHGSTSPGLTSPNYLSFLPDDVGNTYAAGKTISLSTTLLKDSGIITTPTDIDVYKFQICNNRYITFDVKPWALDTVNYDAANLDVRFQLFNAASTSLAIDTPLTKLKTIVGINLTPGSYYFTIDGGRSSNYSDYGSLGKYYIKITSNNIPSITSAITSNSAICAGQNITLTDASSGGPTSWAWTMPGASPASSSAQNPSVTYNTPGTYTITLSATNGTASTCPANAIINVLSAPTPTISSPTNSVCNGIGVTLTASGATSYTWLPTNTTNTFIGVAPTTTTTYTLIGSNGSCSSSTVKTISVSPAFVVTASASSTLLCAGQSATLNFGGASTYTLNPGSIVGNPVVVTPSATVNYNVSGSLPDGCTKTASLFMNVTICTGIENNSALNETNLLVYPNPASGNVTIKTGNNIYSVEIVNALGSLVYSSKDIKDHTIDIKTHNWAKGIYFVKAFSENSNEQFNQKLIIR